MDTREGLHVFFSFHKDGMLLHDIIICYLCVKRRRQDLRLRTRFWAVFKVLYVSVLIKSRLSHCVDIIVKCSQEVQLGCEAAQQNAVFSWRS